MLGGDASRWHRLKRPLGNGVSSRKPFCFCAKSDLIFGFIVVLALLGLCAVLPVHRGPLSIIVPLEITADAASYVDSDFLALAFEGASFVEYSTNSSGHANEFSANLIDEITSRTHGKAIMRLGGTSADYGKYLPGQAFHALPVAEVNNYQDVGHTTIGPSYWELCESFPDAQYIIQVPLATTNISETIAWVQSAISTIGWEKIHSIEIGNEPDLYSKDFRGFQKIELGPPQWQGQFTNETYVGNFTKYAKAIANAVELPDGRIFQAFDISTHFGSRVPVDSYIFDTQTCFDLGIDWNDTIKTVAHHYYQNDAVQIGGDLAKGLMDVNATHTHLDALRRRVDYLKTYHPGIPFILSEVGNSLCRSHMYEYQNRLGSALWQVDFYLYAMSMGISRIHWQQIMHSGYDMWLPVHSADMEAQVFANYYSQPFVADFIGASNATTIQKLNIVNGDTYPNVAAYAAYEAGHLKRIAIANLEFWESSCTRCERPVHRITVALPTAIGTLRVDHLNSPHGATAGPETITYAGSQWTYQSLGREVKGVRDDTGFLSMTDGNLSIQVESSEAVLIWI